MSVNVAGITLKNPVMAASGSFGYGVEFEDVVTLDRLGGFVVKGLSREPMAGNPPPRSFETAAGMLNAIGLQNVGVRAFLEEKLPLLNNIKNIVFFCNVFGHSQEEYEDVVRMLNDGAGIAAYELNVSCPNTKCGGISFGSSRSELPSLTPVWRAAEFQEREIFDHMGLFFAAILTWPPADVDGFNDVIPCARTNVELDDFEYEPTAHDDVLKRAEEHRAAEAAQE